MFNRLYDRKTGIEEALKRRPGDERHALLTLNNHPNTQVRLNAAHATLAIAPVPSRAVFEQLVIAREFPQAGDASFALKGLDDGSYRPT